MSWSIREGDARQHLRDLADASVQACVTSPPYWGLRDYGTANWDGGDPACAHRVGGQVQDNKAEGAIVAGGVDASRCLDCGATRSDSQLGLEPTPEQYVANMVAVFREVRRVLRDDGTLWLNLGDSYAGGGNGRRDPERWPKQSRNDHRIEHAKKLSACKPKDLVGIPWMVAFALRADGWYLRSDIIWAKPNPMPESVTDRPTKSHEYLFLLAKNARYFYDAEAIREGWADERNGWAGDYNRGGAGTRRRTDGSTREDDGFTEPPAASGRNRRSVWTVTTKPFPGAHFATFPPDLIESCILAGSPPKCCGECGAPWERVVERSAMVVKPTPKREAWQAADDHARTQVGGTMTEPPTSKTIGWRSTCEHDDDSGQATVLDPFAGAGTTGLVALRHDRDFIGIELSSDYAEMARNRIRDDAPLLNVHQEAA